MKERSRSAFSSDVTSSPRMRTASVCCAFSTSTLALAPASAASAAALAALAAVIAAAVRERSAAACSRRWLRTEVHRLELLRAVEFQRRALLIGVGALDLRGRRLDLRRGLRDDVALRLDLPTDARDRRVLGRDLGLGGLDRIAIVAVVELDQQVARVDEGVVDDRDLGDVAGDLGRDDRGVGADIGVVGADDEAPFDEPLVGEMAAVAERGEENDGQNEAARRARRARRRRRGAAASRAT